MGTKETVEGDMKHTDTYYTVPGESHKIQVVTTTGEKKVFPGIGPTDQSGLPLAPRMVS